MTGLNDLPPRSESFSRVFMWYSRRLMAKDFNAVRAMPEHLPQAESDHASEGSAGATIVYLNHPAWWDPITCSVLAGLFFVGREHYAPIDAEALRAYPFFRKLGIFGVEQDGSPRAAAGFLRASSAILKRPGAMLWVTAEGGFRDVRHRPVRLMPGLAHLVRRFPRTPVLPLALEYTHWYERRPECLMRFGAAFRLAEISPEDRPTLADVNAELERRLQEEMDRLARASQAREADRFITLVAGRSGVGGLYDLWRSGMGIIRGRGVPTRHSDLVHPRHPLTTG